jgi:hypothetical protein
MKWHTFASYVNTVNEVAMAGAYLVSANGGGDMMLSEVDRLKKCSAIAVIGAEVEIATWLGIIDSE